MIREWVNKNCKHNSPNSNTKELCHFLAHRIKMFTLSVVRPSIWTGWAKKVAHPFGIWVRSIMSAKYMILWRPRVDMDISRPVTKLSQVCLTFQRLRPTPQLLRHQTNMTKHNNNDWHPAGHVQLHWAACYTAHARICSEKKKKKKTFIWLKQYNI